MNEGDKLQQVKECAERAIGRKCLFCQTHNPAFIAKYPDENKVLGFFSSSPAFLHNGEWQHLLLNAPNNRYFGGYNWRNCDAADHHNYLAIVNGSSPTLEEAVEYAAEFMKGLQ